MSLNKKTKKHFSLQEANNALKLVKPIITDIFECLNNISLIKESYCDLDPETQNHKVAELQKFQHKLIYHLNELKSIGVILTDLIQGVVDFPMIKDGKTAYYCWKYGEEEICFYHDKNCDYRKRTYLYNLANTNKSYGSSD